MSNTDIKGQSYYAASFLRLRRKRVAVLFASVIIIITVAAVFAPLVAPHDPYKINLEQRFQPTSWRHICGTDHLGRDIFSRIVYGARISLMVGFIAPIISIVIGTILGSLAGYFGGMVDVIISRLIEILTAFPFILFAIGIMFVLGANVFNLFIALGIVGWTGVARFMRAEVLRLKEREFITACRACGGSDYTVITRHLLPNCVSTIIVLLTASIPGAIMGEAGLSYLGLGVQPPTVSWGSMLNEAFPYIQTNPSFSFFAGLAIILLTLSFNMLGDGLRDALDPKLT